MCELAFTELLQGQLLIAFQILLAYTLVTWSLPVYSQPLYACLATILLRSGQRRLRVSSSGCLICLN